jgi:DNA repair protein RadA
MYVEIIHCIFPCLILDCAPLVVFWLDFNAKLVIIDGIIVHRGEFAGRHTLADRQQRLNSMLHKVIRLAGIFNIAIVITNQVESAPDTF